MAVRNDIETVLQDLCRLWTNLEQEKIIDLWDKEEAEPYALPQERPDPLVGWDDLTSYYSAAKARLVRCSMRTWDLRAKLLADDIAVALYQMHWNGEIKGFDHLFGIDSRVTATFRNHGNGWRLCHYVEAPAAPMLHLQKYYAAMADEDFVNGA